MVIVVMLAVIMIMRMIVMLVIVTVLAVTLIMVAVIMMSMIVATVFVVAMIVIVVAMRRVASTGIGSAFRIERRFDSDDTRAEAPHHLLDDVIAPDAKALADDLRRQMAIAEMPGNAHQMKRIGAADLHQRLGRSDHLDQPTVFQHQRIAAAQRHRLFQVEQEFKPARAGHCHAPPMPVIETENHRIGCGLGPAARWANLRRADHDIALIASGLRRR